MMEVSGHEEEVEHCTIVFWTYYIVRAHCRLNENDSDKGVQGVLKLVLSINGSCIVDEPKKRDVTFDSLLGSVGSANSQWMCGRALLMPTISSRFR
jgi:hypothetical protein